MNDFIFSCSADIPQFVAQSLSAIAWKRPDDQISTVSITKDGILILTEDTKTMQATVFLKRNMFRTYLFLQDDAYDFRINLTPLVDALNIDFIKTATRIEIRVNKNTDLQVDIIDNSSVTECTFRTLNYSTAQINGTNLLSFEFSSPDSPEVATFSMDSLHAFSLLNVPKETHFNSCSIVMEINPIDKLFIIKAEGAYGVARSTMDFKQPYLQKVKIVLVETLTAEYSMQSLNPVINAMSFSSETKFRFKGNGMLSIQQAISNRAVGAVETVVEFILQPIENSFAI